MINSKMFPFITDTWNPLAGECKHHCTYCWAKKLQQRYPALTTKYEGEPRLVSKEFNKLFQPGDFIFVCDMTDLFGDWVPKEHIQRVLDRMMTSRATYLLLTKNPARYLEFDLPKNAVAGATIETDYQIKVSDAPWPIERLKAMATLNHPRKMISIEPVMMFSPLFADLILYANPEFVAIGYDNYDSKLPEPLSGEVQKLINVLEGNGVNVFRKTIREARIQ